MRPWKPVQETLLGDFRVFTLHRQLLEHPETGARLPFFVMRTVDWCNVIALTPDERVVLVRQPRAGTSSVTLEIPGGMVEPGESARAAAMRELLEETGYSGDEVLELGMVHPNPAIQNNRCTTFCVTGARRTADPAPDPGEQIEVELHRLEDVDALIDAGEITHALVVAAFSHLRRAKRSPGR